MRKTIARKTIVRKTIVHKRITSNAGLSILELLIALALAGIIMSVMFQFFIGASKSTQKISNNTALINEAQLIQQFIGSRLIESAYIFPTGYRLTLGNTALTRNYERGNDATFTVGRDTIIAGLIAPGTGEDKHMFYAYYPMPRSAYIAATQGGITLDPSGANDDATWVLVEYRKMFELPLNGVGDILDSDIEGGEAYLLAEYIEPATGNATQALEYEMFNFDTDTQSIRFNLRMLHYTKGAGDCRRAIRHPQVACNSESVATPLPEPFTQEIIPRNFFIGSDFQ